MSEKILLINVHSFANSGDAALTLATIGQLEKSFPQSKLTLLVDDLETYQESYQVLISLYHWVRGAAVGGVPKWNVGNLLGLIPATLVPVLAYRLLHQPVYWFTPKPLRPTLKAYLETDLVVSKPGGFLYSSGLGLTFLIAVYSMAMAILAGKPLFVYPQSVGPLVHRWECTLIRWLVSRSNIFMVREEKSLAQLELCGVNREQARLLPDTAFDFRSLVDAKKWLEAKNLDFLEGPFMGMTVIQWDAQSKDFQDQTRYEKALAGAARHWLQKMKGRIVIFTQASGPSKSQDDRPASRRVVDLISESGERVLFIEESLPPGLLKSLYGEMDVFIGTRMHSNIFALSEGVPVIAIGYYHKTQGIMEMLGLRDWVLEIREIEEQNLISMLDEIWGNRTLLREKILINVAEIVEQAGQAGLWVAEEFQKYKETK